MIRGYLYFFWVDNATGWGGTKDAPLSSITTYGQRGAEIWARTLLSAHQDATAVHYMRENGRREYRITRP